jgi:hypothetical protein
LSNNKSKHKPQPGRFCCDDADIELALGVRCPHCDLAQHPNDFEQTATGWRLPCRDCGLLIVAITPKLPILSL